MPSTYLVERLGDIPSIIPPNMIVEPLDSSYGTSEEDVTSTIRGQLDYVRVVSPITYLHNAMQNDFYTAWANTEVEEYQNVIDYANELKTLFNITYFDNSVNSVTGISTFREKVQNITDLLNFSPYTQFLPYLNITKSFDPSKDIDYQNDFLRNIAFHLWAMRKWAGTVKSYNMVFSFINRLGGVHLGAKYYTSGVLTQFTEKIFRALDNTQFDNIIPNVGTGFNLNGDSNNIKGTVYLDKITPIKYTWDSGNTFDQSPAVSLVVEVGDTGVTLSGISSPSSNLYEFSINSVLGAIPGTMLIAGTPVNLTSDNIVSTTAVADAIFVQLSSLTDFPWSVIQDNFTLRFSYKNSSFISWDRDVDLLAYKKSILLEVGLDRLLSRELGDWKSGEEYLIDNEFLNAMSSFLPECKQARDSVYVGSQLSLVTNASCFYDDIYSYPTILTSSLPSTFYIHDNASNEPELTLKPKSTTTQYSFLMQGRVSHTIISLPIAATFDIGSWNISLWTDYPSEVPTYISIDVLKVDKDEKYTLLGSSTTPVNITDTYYGNHESEFPVTLTASLTDRTFSGDRLAIRINQSTDSITTIFYGSIYFPSRTLTGTVIDSHLTRYSHPNIKADFQTFKYLPDKETINYTQLQQASYIKIGTGRHPSLSTWVSKDSTGGWSNPNIIIPYDIKEPVFYTPLGQNEKDRYLDYSVINAVVHPTTLKDYSTAVFTRINPLKTNYFVPSLIDLQFKYLTQGCVNLAMNISYSNPTPEVSCNVTGLAFGTAIQENPFTFSLRLIPSLDSVINPTITVSYDDATYPVTLPDTYTPIELAQWLSNPPSHVNSESNGGYKFGEYKTSYTTSQGIVYLLLTSNTGSINQRVLFSEVKDNLGNYVIAKNQEQFLGGDYADITTDTSPTSTNDIGYSELDGYLPITDKHAISFLPLMQSDTYPSLYKGLVAEYTYDTYDETTKITLDSSGYGNDLKAINGTTFEPDEGLVTNCFDFNGTNHCLDSQKSSHPQIDNLSKFSVSFAYKRPSPAVSQGDNPIILKGNLSSIGWSVLAGFNPTILTDYLYFRIYKQDGTYNSYNIFMSFGDWANPVGEWNKMVLVFDGELGRLTSYINGKLFRFQTQTLTTPLAVDSSHGIRIGGDGTAGFNGCLCEVRVWDRCLSNEEALSVDAFVESRLTSLLGEDLKPSTAYIDHAKGLLISRMQWNNNGPLQQTQYASTLQNRSYLSNVSLKRNSTEGIVKITELGVFDAVDNMIAYASFPPIHYDSDKYHSAYSLLIKDN